MTTRQRDFFAAKGFLNLGPVLDQDETAYFEAMFDDDRRRHPCFWHAYGHHQYANYDALVTSPQFDELIRHPAFAAIDRGIDGWDGLLPAKSGCVPWGRTMARCIRAGTGTGRTGMTIRYAWTTCNSWSTSAT